MQVTPEILKDCEFDDRRAQKNLYEIYFRMHMSLCFSYYGNEEDARAVLNMGFLKVCRNIATVNQNPKVFYSWSRKILVNTIIDDYRKNKKYLDSTDTREYDREMESTINSDYNQGMESLEEADIKKMIKMLPETARSVFMLYVVEGFNHREIADALGINEGTSKWYLSIARKQLRDMLERVEEIEAVLRKMVI